MSTRARLRLTCLSSISETQGANREDTCARTYAVAFALYRRRPVTFPGTLFVHCRVVATTETEWRECRTGNCGGIVAVMCWSK